ncbi:hypothetical protein E3N88_00043 [Mikania micrantha]|uniref:Replication factor A C-terminal domain-containing protein n=1 Tax=Mikania micrantha TaxID=192012 RepID=A0A5N6PYD7_9ASTR|nr:hypothetical protein E3N88_00043 [Mikania micrantha]
MHAGFRRLPPRFLCNTRRRVLSFVELLLLFLNPWSDLHQKDLLCGKPHWNDFFEVVLPEGKTGCQETPFIGRGAEARLRNPSPNDSTKVDEGTTVLELATNIITLQARVAFLKAKLATMRLLVQEKDATIKYFQLHPSIICSPFHPGPCQQPQEPTPFTFDLDSEWNKFLGTYFPSSSSSSSEAKEAFMETAKHHTYSISMEPKSPSNTKSPVRTTTLYNKRPSFPWNLSLFLGLWLLKTSPPTLCSLRRLLRCLRRWLVFFLFTSSILLPGLFAILTCGFSFLQLSSYIPSSVVGFGFHLHVLLSNFRIFGSTGSLKRKALYSASLGLEDATEIDVSVKNDASHATTSRQTKLRSTLIAAGQRSRTTSNQSTVMFNVVSDNTLSSQTYRCSSSSPFYEDLGDCSQVCEFCGAMFWFEERLRSFPLTVRPRYNVCCKSGRITITHPKNPPEPLKTLMDDKPKGAAIPIKVRVLHKWKPYRNKDVYCYLIIDKYGSGIQSLFEKTEEDHFNKIINLMTCYTFSNYVCVNAPTIYSVTPHRAALKIGKAATIIPMTEINNIPHHYFNFVPYNDLTARVYHDKILTEIASLVDIEALTNKKQHVVAAISSLRVSEFKGKIQMASTSATRVHTDPDINIAKTILARYCITATIADETSSTAVTIFDQAAKTLIGISCFDMVVQQGYTEPTIIPPAILSLIGQPKIFQLQQPRDHNIGRKRFNVNRVFINNSNTTAADPELGPRAATKRQLFVDPAQESAIIKHHKNNDFD